MDITRRVEELCDPVKTAELFAALTTEELKEVTWQADCAGSDAFLDGLRLGILADRQKEAE